MQTVWFYNENKTSAALTQWSTVTTVFPSLPPHPRSPIGKPNLQMEGQDQVRHLTQAPTLKASSSFDKCLFMRKTSELPLWCLAEGLSPQTAFLWSAGQDKTHGWTLNGQKSEGEMLQCQDNSSQMTLSRQWEIEVTESESPFSNLSLWFGVKAVLLRGDVPRRVVVICCWTVWAVVCKLLCSSTSGWKEVNGEG